MARQLTLQLPRVCAVLLMTVVGPVSASNSRTIPLELPESQMRELGDVSCPSGVDFTNIVRHLDAPLGDTADVQCKPTGHYEGYIVSQLRRCARLDSRAAWMCESPIPSLLFDEHLVRHPHLSAGEALAVMRYLGAAPHAGQLRIDPAWIKQEVLVMPSGEGISVSTGEHVILLQKTPASSQSFRVKAIQVCQGDTCHPLGI